MSRWAFGAVAGLAMVVAGFAAERPPNFVLILADDLGWADLGCYGNTFNETPHLDRLAKQGTRFTQFYAGPVCSPTRANLQSGQDQARFGITQHIPGHRRPFAKLADPVVASHLPLEVVTFAERLREAGYATGYCGKWHLGEQGFGPREQGWETVVEGRGHTLARQEDGGKPAGRTAEFLTEKACEFMRVNREKPFVLQVSHFAVHIPLTAAPELLEKFQGKQAMPGYPSRPEYAALLAELDQSVGAIAAEVDRLGLSEHTLLLFLSDNGGLEHEQSGRIVTSNRPLRGEKGTLYEGGIRVPAIARWPGRVPNDRRCDHPAISYDLYPTMLELAGVKAAGEQAVDGVSLVPCLRNPEALLGRAALHWHLPHYHHSTPASAMRREDLKLIEFFEDGRLELYNLRHDPAESKDLSQEQGAKAREMQRELAAWRRKVGAQMPIPNANYDPARADQLGKGKGKKRAD